MKLYKSNDQGGEKKPESSAEQRIIDYFNAKGVDTSSFGSVPRTYAMMPFVNKGDKVPDPEGKMVSHGYAGMYLPEQDQIRIDPRRANDPQMRYEEVIHAMQDEMLLNPTMANKIQKLSGMLGVTPESPMEDQYAVLEGEDRYRDLEAEAKLTSLKIDLIDQGILDASGEVKDEDLYKIQEYMLKQAEMPQEDRSGAEYFLQPYFRDLENEDQRKQLLKVLNKL